MPELLSAGARGSSRFFSPTTSVTSSFSKIDVFAYLNVNRLMALSDISTLGPVVWTRVSTNPGLNFNPGFFIFLSKALSRIIFSILFRVSKYQIVGKENLTEFAF